MLVDYQGSKIQIYFSENLKYLLNKNHVSFGKLATAIGYDNDYVYKVVQWANNISLPTVEQLIKIALFFNCDISEILTVNLKERDSIIEKQKSH